MAGVLVASFGSALDGGFNRCGEKINTTEHNRRRQDDTRIAKEKSCSVVPSLQADAGKGRQTMIMQ